MIHQQNQSPQPAATDGDLKAPLPGLTPESCHQFASRAGIPVAAISSEQMREVDRIAMEETGPNLYQMMENAGRALAELSIQTLGNRWRDSAILILAGSGGNGGGGITAGRHLANAGANPILCLSSPDTLSGVPEEQLTQFRYAGGSVVSIEDALTMRPTLIIDALVGYSLKGNLRGAAASLTEMANATDATIISLDIPSGVNATTGERGTTAICPDKTLTLALPKTGMNEHSCGEILLADLGIPRETFRRAGINYSSPFGGDRFIPLCSFRQD